MLMSKVNKGGRPFTEPSSLRSVRLPVRLWNMVYKASKDFRSVNEYFLKLVEDDLVKRKLLKKSERKKLSSTNKNNSTKG
mgnify:FL=1